LPIGVVKMKSRVWILLYVVLLLLLFFLEFKTKAYAPQASMAHGYEIQKSSGLDQLMQTYTQPLDVNGLSNQQWGIVFKKVKKEIKVKTLKRMKLTEVSLKGKTICIEKGCFKLLGIFRGPQGYRVSFYEAKAKEKIKEFSKGEIMREPIGIKTIRHNEVVLSEINSTREWSLKLFDINSSKYKPKEFE